MRTCTLRIKESVFQAQVIQLAGLTGWMVAHFRSVKVTRQSGATYWATPVEADGEGFPDLILIKSTRIVAAELKVPPNQASDAQIKWLGAFATGGAESYLWTPEDWPEIQEVLTR